MQSPSDFIVAKRMHHLAYQQGEQVETWYLANVSPELFTTDIEKAERFDASHALALVMEKGPGHWLAHVNGQAFAYDSSGRITASIPLEQIP